MPEQECGLCGGSVTGIPEEAGTPSEYVRRALGSPASVWKDVYVSVHLLSPGLSAPPTPASQAPVPQRSSSSFSRHCLPPAIRNTPLLLHPPSWPNCLCAPAGPSASAQPFDVRCLGLSLPLAPHIVPDNLDHPQPQLPGLYSPPSVSASSPGPLLGPRPRTNQPPPSSSLGCSTGTWS